MSGTRVNSPISLPGQVWSRIGKSLVVLLALGISTVTPAAAAGAEDQWRGPDGQPLPFDSPAEVVEFLRSAEVVSMEEIQDGSTHPLKMLLEKDGVQLHAIFRSFVRVQERIEDPRTGQFIMGAAKDSAMFEAAAYELAKMLEIPLIPPTVRRVLNNRDGTLQLWIETATTETQRRELGVEPPHPSWWSGIMQTLRIWDNLIFNADRNTGNFLIDPDWGVWFVDHTRAFQQRRDLTNLDSITFCERRLWERLRTVTDGEIQERMSSYLDGREIGALLSRRERIVAHIEKLIAERGEDQVIFRYSHDVSDWVSLEPAVTAENRARFPRSNVTVAGACPPLLMPRRGRSLTAPAR